MDRSAVRQSTLAMIAASAVFLGGAMLPNIRISNPSVLYLAGQVRLAIGDRDGGFQLLSRAAAARGARVNMPAKLKQSNRPDAVCNLKQKSSDASPVRANANRKQFAKQVPPTSSEPVLVAAMTPPHPPLPEASSSSSPWEIVNIDLAQRKAEIARAAVQQANVHRIMQQVRGNLEHQRVPIPPDVAVWTQENSPAAVRIQ